MTVKFFVALVAAILVVASAITLHFLASQELIAVITAVIILAWMSLLFILRTGNKKNNTQLPPLTDEWRKEKEQGPGGIDLSGLRRPCPMCGGMGRPIDGDPCHGGPYRPVVKKPVYNSSRSLNCGGCGKCACCNWGHW